MQGNTAAASIYLQNLTLFSAPGGSTANPLSGALKGCLGSLDAACIEKLLLHCASALESNDVTLAQQVMWVLNNVASATGDPNQKLTSWFLKALINRATRLCPTSLNLNGGVEAQSRLMSVTELAVYVDLIPWHRFGFSASNSVILGAIEGYSKVHVLDFSITHCMQWPTLIDALAKTPEGPPSLRITVPSCRPNVPPFLNVCNDEIGFRLGNFAKFRNVPFEFSVLGNDESSCEEAHRNYEEPPLSPGFRFDTLISQLTSGHIQIKDDEALIINCQNWLRYLSDEPDEVNFQDSTPRDEFLEIIRGLNPRTLIVVDEDVDLSSPSLAERITTCFNYLWIPFDAFETFLSKDNQQRMDCESDLGHKIDNVIACEGSQRIERPEVGAKLSQRMRNAGFSGVPFGDDTADEVKSLLDEHSSGWGMKREEDMLVLTWKGHSSVFATAWITTSEGF
ncbi:hypothetical protein MLD38_033391 [Melastoma candidum]|uniref:Uncharacterized protein n=1 Tax=Melastoma candidum TaxID=119954 RepID=A0ACB9M726_9MYRT|nr:hypothetical protein MLD38_033391 [Melastoma candidum]